MKREILFRGKTIQGSKWVYGCLLINWSDTCQIWEKDSDGSVHNYIVDPESVGQYTGLIDRNGNKVYEGDVLQCDWGIQKQYNPMQPKKDINIANPRIQKCEVYFSEHSASFCISTSKEIANKKYIGEMALTNYRCSTFCKIIGNIYDSPELVIQRQSIGDVWE